MDYRKHYNKLCERSKNRSLDQYTESHHIIPYCMNGPDIPENRVDLTPEEHYIAHQLLIKIYPDHDGLIWAAHQMTRHPNGKRSNNKLYGWLKRKYSKIAKARIGEKNGSYGRSWYYNPETLENRKFLQDEIPSGWIKGRKLKSNTKCLVCQEDTGSKRRKYCDSHIYHNRKFISPPWIKDSSKRYKYSGNDENKRRERISKSMKGNKNFQG